MKNQPLEILQSRLKRLRETMPLLPEEFRMDPKEALIYEQEIHLMLAKEEKNESLAKMFEVMLELAKTL